MRESSAFGHSNRGEREVQSAIEDFEFPGWVLGTDGNPAFMFAREVFVVVDMVIIVLGGC
jgi:hypothetical protein